ncbi:DUF1842 domain-containing protein [Pseudoalteromonas luteoviolacea]|uniref:DUF1842 domain-containing protein n=2 Tax=Pseudoalteromonas luteoviolacea TaxID=43657 RepID=A0A0F6AIQ7_9GAMM|nr:DUF1842 domain-containing protein [Pseudoalteromonas luteoviolacea]AOT06425.1 hypothetical protein S4054249_00310 [Pseudoalteromonas luteoviolacea]AOT11342.1 hypothetical protein S40542_00310 [Pseudoalteromonas luteoviolacea]AOT16255.1 hypothetical protein S4054_00310 [Pseudoalteromonas luteoviolacea]KKE85569.1 hypothetical protein N479_04525 [Pseudoalteromonas luteoviolacea S4054]KZN73025.1 hypothetical protein N481_13305 [Pseudoalteromonas luteoviolacea S4047-1]
MTQCGINGLFLINYLIGLETHKPQCEVSLLVYTPDKTLSGRAKMFFSQYSDSALMFHLNGEFHYRYISGTKHIAVNLLGQHAHASSHHQNAAYHYLKLDLLLNPHWHTGYAELYYRDLCEGTWEHTKQLNVTQTHNNRISELSQLALQVKN